MTSIKVNFYYIKSDFKILVTKLCEKLIKEKYKVLIKVGSKKEQEELDDYLWSYEEYSFLPHRTSLDTFDNDEKIIILNGDEEETFLRQNFLKRLEFLSLDIEGMDYEVLMNFNLQKYDISPNLANGDPS